MIRRHSIVVASSVLGAMAGRGLIRGDGVVGPGDVLPPPAKGRDDR